MVGACPPRVHGGICAGMLALAACGVAACRNDSAPSSASTGLNRDSGGLTASLSSQTPADAGSEPVRLPRATIDAVTNPMHLPAYSGPTGSVEGVVLVAGPEAPEVAGLDVHACPAALDTYHKLFRAGLARADGARPLADAIVVITGYSGFYLPEKEEVAKVTITARCGYPLRTIAMTFGQRLEIMNDSTIAFAPYLEGVPEFTILIAPPLRRGQPVAVLPTRADHFALRDQLQSFVRGDVYVLRQPLHAVSGLDGKFRIDGVPAGSLKVGAQSPTFPGATVAEVAIPTNGTVSLDLMLRYAPEGAPAASTGRSSAPAHAGP